VTACVICQRNDSEDGWTVCRHDLNRLDDDLARILELTNFAAAALTPESRQGDGGRSVPGSRPPLDIAALDAALGLDAMPILEEWVRDIRARNNLAPYGAATEAAGATLVGVVTFLRSWLLWCAESPSWPMSDYAREVHDQVTYLARFDPAHETPDGMRVPCAAPHPDADGRDCGYRISITTHNLADDLTCRRCGNVTTAGRLILVALNDPAVIVWAYADVIEAAIGIPQRTLRSWAQTGVVERKGSQYDVGAAFRARLGVGA
jgi:hypothetical protein